MTLPLSAAEVLRDPRMDITNMRFSFRYHTGVVRVSAKTRISSSVRVV